MSETRTPEEEDAFVLLCLRNDFYRQRYQLIFGVCILGLFVIAALVGMVTYLVKHPPEPLYFATDNAGRFIREISLHEPNMSNEEVTSWVVAAVEGTYSYDFINYHAELQSAQKYFTDFGWRQYMQGLVASNNLVALTERKLIFSAKVVGTPKLLGAGRVSAAEIYSWKFEMPVLVTYFEPPYDNKSKFQNALDVTVIIQRQDVLTSYKGIGIVQLIGTLATTEPQSVTESG